MSVFKHPKSPYYQIEFHINGHPVRGSSKTANKKEAEAIERQWREKARADLVTKKATGNAVMTLSIAGGRYMQEVMQGKASEGDSYRALKRLIKIIGGDTRMDAITDSHVADYIATRRKETRWGRKEFKDGTAVGTVSGATINREVAVLKRLFFRSRRTWKIPLPNEPDWRGHIQPEEPERVCEFDDAQTDTLYTTVRDDYLPWFEFAHVSGLRLGETILRWTSINWTTGQIRTKGKGNKWVVTQISPTIREILQPLIGHHPEYVFTYVAKRTCKRTGKVRGQRYPLTYEGIQSHWGRLKKAEGLHGIRIHDIRHDAASKIVRATGNLKIAKALLNHSSIAVTDKYAHVLPDEIVAGMEAVANSRKNSRNNKKKVA